MILYIDREYQYHIYILKGKLFYMDYISHFNDEIELRKCIASSVKKIRNDNKLSQEKLAEMLNVSVEHISRIENCKYTCSIMLIFKICSLFKLTLHDFFKISDKSNNDIVEYLGSLSLEKFDTISNFCKQIENYINKS